MELIEHVYTTPKTYFFELNQKSMELKSIDFFF